MSTRQAADGEPGSLGKFGATSISENLALFMYAGFPQSYVEPFNVNTSEYLVEQNFGMRLDAYLAQCMPDLSRSNIQKLIASGHITVNDAVQRTSYKVQLGDRISVTIPPPESTSILAENIPLDVRYEDNQIIVINKPKGMTVHPAPGSKTGTLVNAVLAHSDDLSGIGGVERPGIVHRLDKDTTGLLVVAKTDLAHSSLQKQIQERSAERRYIALVWGETKFGEAVVDAPIGRHPTDRQKMAVIKDTGRYTSRVAVTNLNVIERFTGFTLLEAKLDTGRTHQIRVHCSFIGHPVVGDPTYGGIRKILPTFLSKLEQRELSRLIDDLHGQALHAFYLSFDHPVTHKRMAFEAPLPAEMSDIIEWLRKTHGSKSEKS